VPPKRLGRVPSHSADRLLHCNLHHYINVHLQRVLDVYVPCVPLSAPPSTTIAPASLNSCAPAAACHRVVGPLVGSTSEDEVCGCVMTRGSCILVCLPSFLAIDPRIHKCGWVMTLSRLACSSLPALVPSPAETHNGYRFGVKQDSRSVFLRQNPTQPVVKLATLEQTRAEHTAPVLEPLQNCQGCMCLE
jgi:hypothetical protein